MNDETEIAVFDSEQVALCNEKVKPIEAGSTTLMPANQKLGLDKNLTFYVGIKQAWIERDGQLA